MGVKCSQLLLKVAKVQLQEACITHEGKLEYTKKAYDNINQIKNRETNEQELDTRGKEKIKTKERWKEKIKVGMHNINGLKGDSLKLE